MLYHFFLYPRAAPEAELLLKCLSAFIVILLHPGTRGRSQEVVLTVHKLSSLLASLEPRVYLGDLQLLIDIRATPNLPSGCTSGNAKRIQINDYARRRAEIDEVDTEKA